MGWWTKKRRARDSNSQPLAGYFISNEAANHSLTLPWESILVGTVPLTIKGEHLS